MLIKITFRIAARHPCEAKTKARHRLHRFMMDYPETMYLSRLEVKKIDKTTRLVDCFVVVESWKHDNDRVTVISQ